MQTVTVSWLKALDSLKNVPDDQLEWLIDNCETLLLEDGEELTVEGQPVAGPHIIISGRIAMYFMQNNVEREAAIFEPGAITGYLPYSRAKVANVHSRALGPTQIMTYPTDRIREMISTQFELTQALVHIMTNRVRNYTEFQQQNEKMMALGKLSAGLTHELNNPASAIVRDAESLAKHLNMQPQAFKSVIAIRMKPEQVDAVGEELFRVLGEYEDCKLTLKQRTAKEDELTDLFDELFIDNSMDMAENFVQFCFEPDDVLAISKHIPKEFLTPVFNWINNLLVTEKMVKDIGESARRIGELVNSVKNYTHMDQGQDKQYADIHTGIRNTLTMLGYKFKKGNVALAEDFDETLPPVKAQIGELNQVWTNLIDNALDAMETNKQGILTIKTERDREFVQVTIGDNGIGIPEDIRTRIFDPFFTTKAMGKGTGLGLDVVQRIVNQHNGSIKVKSQPGHTEFVVCFPIDG
ncbi:MAG TPA: ATP-binding protein [Mucilaginibacter sp.]|nr:ATP-binding protein [Mucilaginibacter sp.]